MYMYLFYFFFLFLFLYFLKVDYFKAAVLTSFTFGLIHISLVKKNYPVIETIKLFFLFTKQSQIGIFFILLF